MNSENNEFMEYSTMEEDKVSVDYKTILKEEIKQRLKGAKHFFIGNLNPDVKEWSIVIDETGHWDEKESESLKFLGMVAVLVPKGTKLPESEGHAMDEDGISKLKKLNDLLNPENGCGIIGIKADMIDRENVSGQGFQWQWRFAITKLVGLILRLIPLGDEEEKCLNFYIEGCGNCGWVALRKKWEGEPADGVTYTIVDDSISKTEKWGRCVISDDLKSEVSYAEERFRKVYFKKKFKINSYCFQKGSNEYWVEKVEKGLSEKFREMKKWNAYADVVAYCWGAALRGRNRVLDKLRGVCLLEKKISITAMDILDQLKEDRLVPIDFLNELWLQGEEGDGFFFKKVMEKFHNIKIKYDIWKKYLEDVVVHLKSGEVNMKLLINQIDFLNKNKKALNLSKETEFKYTLVSLKLDNHQGVVQKDKIEYLEKNSEKIESLFNRDARLCTSFILDLAVNCTNAFRFEDAEKFLLLLKEYSCKGLESVSDENKQVLMKRILGVENYGVWLSSLGQTYAFLEKYEEAIKKFDEAIDVFGELKNERKIQNILQTSAYRVIAKMDMGADVWDCLVNYLKLEDEKDSKCLNWVRFGGGKKYGNECAEKYKYCHVIFLRYLIVSRGEKISNLRKDYLKNYRNWARKGSGHPWEMIWFYRGILIRESNLPGCQKDCQECLEKAYKIAREGGDLMKEVIAAVIAAAIFHYKFKEGEKKFREALSDLEKMGDKICLGDDRLAALKNYKKNDDLIVLIKKVLPFNFR